MVGKQRGGKFGGSVFNGTTIFEQERSILLHYFSGGLFIFFHNFFTVNIGEGILKGGIRCGNKAPFAKATKKATSSEHRVNSRNASAVEIGY